MPDTEEQPHPASGAKAEVMAPRLGLTLAQVWAWLPPILMLAWCLRTSIAPQDFWWHLKVGEITWQTGSLPTTDLFSFTRSGEAWVNQAWLMQILLYQVHAYAGVAGIILLQALVIVGGYAILGLTLSRIYGGLGAWVGVLVAFGTGLIHQGVRPQIISFLCFGLLIAAIERDRAGRATALRFTPLLFLFWGNAHAGFIFGLGALGIYLLSQLHLRSRKSAEYLAIGVTCALAVCINPEGPMGLVRYLLGFFESDVTVAGNLEFQPLSIRKVDGAMFAVSLACLAYTSRHGGRPSLDQSISLIVFGLASLLIRRISPWFGFVLAPVLAAAIAARTAEKGPASSRRHLRCTLYLASGIVVLISSLPWLRSIVPFTTPALVESNSPVRGVAALCEVAPPGSRVFTAQDFASFQIFHCPGRRIFIDSRLELYSGAIWRDYFAVERARFDWERILDRYQVEWLFLKQHPPHDADDDSASSQHRGLIDAARESTSWTEVHADELSIIFARADQTHL